MKSKKVDTQKLNAPIVFQSSNTVPEKMAAITELSKAVYELSRALNSIRDRD